MMQILFCVLLSLEALATFAQENIGDELRGYLPVPAALDYQHTAQNFKVLTNSILGTNTTNLCESIEYRIAKSIEFRPNSDQGIPMLRATTSGASLNLGHNSLSLYRAQDCNSSGVGLEIGYSPTNQGSREQPHTIIVENGLFSDWNIGILVHAGVRNVILRNLVLVDNALPIAMIGRNSAPGVLQTEVITVSLENVIIVNSNTDQLKCLNWVRSYLTDGSVVGVGTDAIAASSSCGYVQSEVMPRVNSPFTGVPAALEVYAGIYGYGVSNINMNNVSVSNIGYNRTPATLHTGAYGIWFRNCRSIFMQDIEATKIQSAVATAGLYIDQCQVVSVINAQLSNNATTQITAPGLFPATPEKLWAAAMVLKDSSYINASSVVMSNTSAPDNAWGVRSIFAHNSTLKGLEITRAWIDGLGADHVYGIDLGDLYRNDGTSRLPAGSAQHTTLKNISISNAHGKNSEISVGSELKCIYLGDGSDSVMLGNIFIEDNAISSTSTGKNSGIEFGASSVTTGATSTISNLVLQEIAIQNNGAGIVSNAAAFCGIAGVTGGSLNRFEKIKLTDSYIKSNSGDALRISDSAGVTGGVIDSLNVENVILDRNQSALSVGAVTNATLVNCSCSENTGTGGAITIGSTVTTMAIDECMIHGNAGPAVVVTGNAEQWTMTRSHIDHNGGAGVQFQATLTDGIINESSIISNTGIGLLVTGAVQGCFIQKSHIEQNGDAGISLMGDVRNLTIDTSYLNRNVNYGLRIATTATELIMSNVQVCLTSGAAAVYGIFVGTSNSLQLRSVQCNEHSSTGGDVTGISVGNASNLVMKNVEICRNSTTAGTVKGLYANIILHATLSDINASENSGTLGAFGVYVALDIVSLLADGIIANYNSADLSNPASVAAGIYVVTSLTSGILKNISGQSNYAGARAYGLYLAGLSGVTLDRIYAVGNRAFYGGTTPAFTVGAGIYFNGGSSVTLTRFKADNNQEDQVVADYIYTDEFMTTLENATNTSNQIAHHFSVRNKAGAYGIYAEQMGDFSLEYGSASFNRGVRGYGVHIRMSDNVAINKVDASENSGSGGVWANETNPFTGTSTAVPQPSDQMGCLFGYQSGAGNTINLSQAYQYLLASLDEYAGFVTTQTPCTGLCLLSSQTIASMYRIIWSTLAQFRRFATGVGIALLNCDGTQVDGCRAVGNYSNTDSAAGIAMYRSNLNTRSCTQIGLCSCSGQGSSIANCVTQENAAWTYSQRGTDFYAINGSIDLTDWLPLYTFLGVQTYVGTGTYDVQPIATFPGPMIPEGSPINGITPPTATFTMNVPLTSANTFSWTLNPRKMAVGFTPTTSSTLFDFSAPLPIAAGIVLESMTDCFVHDNTASLSKGNVGVAFGILADGALSSMIMENKVTHNSADALGQAWGVADLELTTPNAWYKNFFMANRVDTFLNYSYLVIFDPAVVLGQSFPLIRVYPGDVSALSDQLPYDNIEVYFKANRQQSSSVNEFMAQGWNTAVPKGYGLMS